MRTISSIINRLTKKLKRGWCYVIQLKWIRFSIEDLFHPVIKRDPELELEIERLINAGEIGNKKRYQDIQDSNQDIQDKDKPTTFDLNDPKNDLTKYRLELEKKAKGIKGIDKGNHNNQAPTDNGHYIGLDRVEGDNDIDSRGNQGKQEGNRKGCVRSTLKGPQEKTHENRSPANNDLIEMPSPLTQDKVDKIVEALGENDQALKTPFLNMIGKLPPIRRMDESFTFPIQPTDIEVTGLDADGNEVKEILPADPPGYEPGSEIALMEEGANSPDYVNADDLEFDDPLPYILRTDSFSAEPFIDDTDKLKEFPTDQKFPYCRQQDIIYPPLDMIVVFMGESEEEVKHKVDIYWQNVMDHYNISGWHLKIMQFDRKGGDWPMGEKFRCISTYIKTDTDPPNLIVMHPTQYEKMIDQKEPEGARSNLSKGDGENRRPVGAGGIVMDKSGNMSEPVKTRGNLSGSDGDKSPEFETGGEVPGPCPFGLDLEADESVPVGTIITKGIQGAAIGGIIGARPEPAICEPMPMNLDTLEIIELKKEMIVNMENQFIASSPIRDPEDNEKVDTDKYPGSRRTKEYLKKHLGVAQAMDKQALQDKKFIADANEHLAEDQQMDLTDLDKIGHI